MNEKLTFTFQTRVISQLSTVLHQFWIVLSDLVKLYSHDLAVPLFFFLIYET
jgi:hypothetical protein